MLRFLLALGNGSTGTEPRKTCITVPFPLSQYRTITDSLPNTSPLPASPPPNACVKSPFPPPPPSPRGGPADGEREPSRAVIEDKVDARKDAVVNDSVAIAVR